MWCRVFSANETMPQPASVQQFLAAKGIDAPLVVTGDDLGWTSIEFGDGQSQEGLRIDRYLTDEDELRDELDTWAAWVESMSNDLDAIGLMQSIISTRQLFTIRANEREESSINELQVQIGQWLAQETNGICQIDGLGFFSSTGSNLLADE
jgi:hypothetical protein